LYSQAHLSQRISPYSKGYVKARCPLSVDVQCIHFMQNNSIVFLKATAGGTEYY